MYSVRTLPTKNRVEVVFNGAHGYDYVQFSEELKDAAMAVRSTEGHFDLLVDFTTADVLPQENAAQSQRNIAWCISQGMRKSANIVPSVTQRMQVKRVSANDLRLSYFGTRKEAECWLAA